MLELLLEPSPAFDLRLERRERLIPELVQPGAQRAEAARIDGVDPPCPDRPVDYQSRLLQDRKMLRYCRAADRHAPRDLTDRKRPGAQSFEDFSAGRITEAFKGSGVCHGTA